MTSLCETCKYDCVGGCLFYCGGVTEWDEENEVVTECDDYVVMECDDYKEEGE